LVFHRGLGPQEGGHEGREGRQRALGESETKREKGSKSLGQGKGSLHRRIVYRGKSIKKSLKRLAEGGGRNFGGGGAGGARQNWGNQFDCLSCTRPLIGQATPYDTTQVIKRGAGTTQKGKD